MKLAIIGATGNGDRRTDYRRAPGDQAATGTLLRVARCIEGHVELLVSVVPVFEYGSAAGQWQYEGEGYGTMTVSPPPLKLLSASVKVTFASMICGAALTVFSRKVIGVVRPVSVGTEFAISYISPQSRRHKTGV